MLEDLTPILEAAAVVPIRVRREPITEEEESNNIEMPTFETGCFNCRHESTSMGVRRRYATIVAYADTDNDMTWDDPIFGMVISPDDTRISGLHSAHWITNLLGLTSIRSARGGLVNLRAGDYRYESMLTQETNIYVRKYVDFTGTSRLVHVNRMIQISNYLRIAGGGRRSAMMRAYIYYPSHTSGVYLEPTSEMSAWDIWGVEHLEDFFRVAEPAYSGSFIHNLLSSTWPDVINQAREERGIGLGSSVYAPLLDVGSPRPSNPGRFHGDIITTGEDIRLHLIHPSDEDPDEDPDDEF